jgi:hypothetical protein
MIVIDCQRRTERRISRDGRGQRSSRGATGVPERERPKLPIQRLRLKWVRLRL